MNTPHASFSLHGSKPVVMIGTPSFEGRPCIEYQRSLVELKGLLCQQGIDHIISLLPGDPYLGKVRSRIVSQLLTDFPNVTDLFFIDDDIGYPPHKVLEFLNHKEDIVCGVYPKKLDTAEWPADLFNWNDKGIALKKKNGLLLGRLVPTGFMRIKKHVIEKMAQTCPRHFEPLPDGKHKICWDMFYAGNVDLGLEKLRKADLNKLSHAETLAWLRRAIGVSQAPEPGEYWGEDYYFTQRWREMGGTIWIDPDIEFTHRGSKAWKGNFAAALGNIPVQMAEED